MTLGSMILNICRLLVRLNSGLKSMLTIPKGNQSNLCFEKLIFVIKWMTYLKANREVCPELTGYPSRSELVNNPNILGDN